MVWLDVDVFGPIDWYARKSVVEALLIENCVAGIQMEIKSIKPADTTSVLSNVFD